MSQIPSYDQMIYPLLRILGEAKEPIAAKVAQDRVADALNLTEEQRLEPLPESPQEVYRNRAGWAHDRLKRRGYSHSPKRGMWQITDEGREFLAKNPNGVTAAQLKELATVARGSLLNSRSSEVAENYATLPETEDITTNSHISPDEALSQSLKEIRASVAVDLLERLHEVSAVRFETIVLDVLHGLGYGLSREDLSHVGRTADAGIDGIISLDMLGLDKVYVQAKKWTSNTIGRPDIQAFYGALGGQRATRGVFITTSSFSREAIRYAEDSDKSIALIDGQRLVELMLELGIGVSHEVIKRPRVDSDYFEVD